MNRIARSVNYWFFFRFTGFFGKADLRCSEA